MKYLFVFCLLVFAFFNTSATAQPSKERYVKPIDEAKKDQSLYVFRERLIKAVRQRDTKYLISVMDPKIKLSFGGDGGIADFKRIWKPDSDETQLWNELADVLYNGGKYSRTGKTASFSAPFIFDGFPSDLDVFNYQVVMTKSLRLRARPDPESKLLGTLSYNVVKVDFDKSIPDPKRENEYTWYKIETLGGKSGFVNASSVRSPIDYRAIFEKVHGRWKMTAFIAGD